MALSPGDKLGPCEIVAPLDAGGMGEVYRTRHAKLNRDVAINVLPAALSLLFLFAIPVFSQTQAAAPAFEVAAVKANKSGEPRMSVDLQPGGKLVMRNVPMKVLIMFAYHLRPEALAGGPAWIESDRYDVVAKAAETGPPDDVRRMVQTLLAERFKLAVHREQKVMEAYGLMLAKSGAKLKSAEAALLSGQGCRPGQSQPGQRHVDCRHVSMAGLADSLQELAPGEITVPVVDQTGLQGSYDFRLDWRPIAGRTAAAPPGEPLAAAPPVEEAGPNIFDAVATQLGLKLEGKKVPLPIIVIDHVERVPIEN